MAALEGAHDEAAQLSRSRAQGALTGGARGRADLEMILGHWGEVVLFYLNRTSAVLDRALDLKRPLVEYARRNLYVTGSGMWSKAYLLRCLEILGVERLLFSTDYPYQHRPGGAPRRFLEAAPLDLAGRKALAHRNWDRLTGSAA